MKSSSITKTELQSLRKRITALEERVRELENRPVVRFVNEDQYQRYGKPGPLPHEPLPYFPSNPWHYQLPPIMCSTSDQGPLPGAIRP